MATSSFDVALIGESHFPAEGLTKVAKELSGQQWTTTCALVLRTDANRTSGGCLAMVRKHWYSKPLFCCIDVSGYTMPGIRLAGRSIKICDVAALVLAGYFLSGGDLSSSTNRVTCYEVERLTNACRVSSVLRADFNSDLRPGITLFFHGCTNCKPLLYFSATLTTCVESEVRVSSDSMIGGFIVSDCLCPLIRKCEVVPDTPWLHILA